MLLFTVLLGLLASRAQAQINYCAGDKNTIGHCETLSYIDRTTTSSDAPLATECQDTCRGVLTDAGDWGVSFIGKIPNKPRALLYPTRHEPQPSGFIWRKHSSDALQIGRPEGYRQNLLLYPCGFSMGRAPGQPLDYEFLMHNQDIVDILDEVSKRFAPLHSGRVAAEGLIRCDGWEATWYVY